MSSVTGPDRKSLRRILLERQLSKLNKLSTFQAMEIKKYESIIRVIAAKGTHMEVVVAKLKIERSALMARIENIREQLAGHVE
jgi:SET domain-containing protein